MTTFLARRRARALAPAIAQRAAHEDALSAMTAEDRAAAQLALLNAAWTESLARSPWARAVRDEIGAPEQFDDWRRVEDVAPRMDKTTLRAAIARVCARQAAETPDIRRLATGGTTAEPLSFPSFRSEARAAAADIWRGRARFGVTPASRLFLLWGHAHLFAAGLRGRLQRFRRHVADAALGYVRHSAYAVDRVALRAAGERLLRARPDYVIGYATALERLAQANADRAEAFAALGLKVVIATAEGFRSAEGRAAAARIFGAPVAMEYGAVETGPMAYETPSGFYATCLTTTRIDVDGPFEGPQARTLLATSLRPRALPLLRYAVGDLIVARDGIEPAVGFAAVVGRVNDAVSTPRGASIHSEAFTHALRDCSEIHAYQIVRGAGGVAAAIRYEADAPLSAAIAAELARRLALIDPSFGALPLEHVERIAASVAGKSPMVVDAADQTSEGR